MSGDCVLSAERLRDAETQALGRAIAQQNLAVGWFPTVMVRYTAHRSVRRGTSLEAEPVQRHVAQARAVFPVGVARCTAHRTVGDLAPSATPRRAAVPQRPSSASRVCDSRGSLHCAPHRGAGQLARAARRVSNRHGWLNRALYCGTWDLGRARALRRRATEPRRPAQARGGLFGCGHLLRAKEPPSSVTSSASARQGRPRPTSLVNVALPIRPERTP